MTAMSTTKPTLTETMVRFTQERYEEKRQRLVDKIRELADEVERESRLYDEPGGNGTPRFASSAERALHTLSWGIANLNAAQLVGVAARADAAEAELSK